MHSVPAHDYTPAPNVQVHPNFARGAYRRLMRTYKLDRTHIATQTVLDASTALADLARTVGFYELQANFDHWIRHHGLAFARYQLRKVSPYSIGWSKLDLLDKDGQLYQVYADEPTARLQRRRGLQGYLVPVTGYPSFIMFNAESY